MKYRHLERFKKAYDALSGDVQEKVFKAFALLRDNQRHSSLMIKKIKGVKEIWEGRIDLAYRFTFHYEKDAKTGEMICVFRNVDNHDE
jgi:mRNA-degrading endonuclease RelE of RelBE toxin-antitoxin system